MNRLAVGVDIGGTNIRLGIISPEGELLYYIKEIIDPSFKGDDIVTFLTAKALASPLIAGVAGGGIGVAATLTVEGVPIPELTNFTPLGDYPIRDKLAASLQIPFLIDNDATLALYGEAHFGAARCYKNVLLLTLGTGIGSALLIDGRIHRGAHGRGSELGETLVYDLQHGNYTALENLISAGALSQRLKTGEGLLFERAERGDGHALALIEELYETLGRLIVNVHLILDLDRVIISGGLAEVGSELVTGLQASFDRLCPPLLHNSLCVETGHLPPHTVGVVGAACFWYEHQGILPKI